MDSVLNKRVFQNYSKMTLRQNFFLLSICLPLSQILTLTSRPGLILTLHASNGETWTNGKAKENLQEVERMNVHGVGFDSLREATRSGR